MKLKKGDKVRFLNDVGGGTVIRIIDQKMVEIMNDDEFEVPVLAVDLVRISSSEQEILKEELIENEETFEEEENFDFRSDRDEPEEDIEEYENTISYIEGNDELNIYAALVPIDTDNITESEMALYVINDSNFQAQAMAFELDEEDASLIWNVHLESNTKVLIKTYGRNELGIFPKIRFQFLFYRYGKFPKQKPLEKDTEVTPLKFYKTGSFVENDFFEEDAIIIKLNEEDLASVYNQIPNEDFQKIKKEKSESDKIANRLKEKYSVSQSPSGIVEIDLHIHELLDDFKGLSNAEMLNIQIETFHRELSLGLKNHDVKKMVFIHGVGAGTLKNELRKALQNDYPQLYFQDASFKEYGFGATMIILRRK